MDEHAVKPSFQAALFARSELLGNGKLGEAYESLADVLEAPFEHGDGGRDCRAGRDLAAHHREGSSQKLAPVRLIGHAVGRQKCQSLTELQGMTLHSTYDCLLLLGR